MTNLGIHYFQVGKLQHAVAAQRRALALPASGSERIAVLNNLMEALFAAGDLEAIIDLANKHSEVHETDSLQKRHALAVDALNFVRHIVGGQAH